MLNLKDGPAKGTYLVRRAPLYLRAVVDADGKADVLDMIEDVPKESERIYVYKRDGAAGTMHVHGKGFSGWYALAEYHYLPEADGEALRDNAAWQKWATEQSNAETEQKHDG